MRIVSAEELDAVLSFPALVDALRAGFHANATAPLRHHHHLTAPDGGDHHLLLMPAWSQTHVGVKTVMVCPENPARGLPGIQASYLLMDAETGSALALLDGARLTLWRTAAASALASSHLARENSEQLLMVGAGALAPYLVRAHASVRPIRQVAVWNRTPEKAEALAETLLGEGLAAAATTDLEAACRKADIVSCATGSTAPLIMGAWLRPGVHVDLVGAFTPSHREADDTALKRAIIFVDTREGVLKEAGDIVQAIASGAIREGDISADLFDLAGGEHPGRQEDTEITLFKSVGTALEDLAAAQHIYDKIAGA